MIYSAWFLRKINCRMSYVAIVSGSGRGLETYSIDNLFSRKTHLRFITKTRLYNFDPLKPHFYIVKLGFTGVYIIFHISAQKDILWVLVRTASPRRFYCGYSLEPPRRGGSNEYPQSNVLSRNMKKIRIFFI